MNHKDFLNSLEKYVLIGWPEIQHFMDHPDWDKCILCQDIDGHPVEDSVYAVPTRIWLDVYNN